MHGAEMEIGIGSLGSQWQDVCVEEMYPIM